MIPAAGGKIAPAGFNCRCPSCGRWPYYGINIKYLYGTSWCCGHCSLPKALSVLSGRSYAECKTLIGDVPGRLTEKVEHTGTLQLPMGLGPLNPLQENYLRKRGFDPKTLSDVWGVQGIGMLGGRLKWRIFFPIHLHGRVVSWTTRNITDQEPRYVSARDCESAVPIGDLLYGIDFVRHAAIIVEGCPDTIRIGPGATALLGTRVSNRQLERLAEIPVRVLALDNDEPGQARASTLAKLLSPLPGRTVIARWESAKDAASADPSEIQELRRRYLE